MRETSFEFERRVFFNNSADDGNDQHVFIVSLARSGTTVLLNALHDSQQFSSLSYADMPFVMSPNLWNLITPNQQHNPPKERMHGDGILITSRSPEAFEEVFWKTFESESSARKEYFKKYTSLINQRYGRSRYLSKNNQNIKRIKLLTSIFPKAKILILFREPIEHCLSLYKQHKKFVSIQQSDSFVSKYMEWIGHSEFGLTYKPLYTNDISYADSNSFDHWLEQWILSYQHLVADFAYHNNITFVSYEKLCENAQTWEAVKDICEIRNDYNPENKFILANQSRDHNCSRGLAVRAKAIYDQLTELSI